MAYLISTTETYRVATETEVERILEEAKNDSRYELTKYTSTIKTVKKGGEVVDEWIRLTLTKVFCEEKEPMGSYQVDYTTSKGAEF